MKFLIKNTTMAVWAVFVILLGLIMSIAQLGFMTITSGIINGIVAILLGATLLTENIAKGAKPDTGNIVILILGALMLLFGISAILVVNIPQTLVGASGILYLISSIAVGIALVS